MYGGEPWAEIVVVSVVAVSVVVVVMLLRMPFVIRYDALAVKPLWLFHLKLPTTATHRCVVVVWCGAVNCGVVFFLWWGPMKRKRKKMKKRKKRTDLDPT